MKDLVVLHAMALIYSQKLASGPLVTLLEEAYDIFKLQWDKKKWPWIAFGLKNPLSQIVILVFEVQVMFG